MSFLKNLISDAVSDGVGKGLRDAVGKAVETAAQPAADKLAGKAADYLNQASQSLEESTQAVKAASEEVRDAAASEIPQDTAAPFKSSGTASLEAALAGWATTVQNAASQAAQNMKECPNCGEVVTADHKFCPKCGSALPERTIAEGFLCPNCGKQNVPGTTFCSECGTRLPASEEAIAKQMAKWDTMLPQYPKWAFGGEPELTENGEMNGEPTVYLHVEGAGMTELNQYVALLKAEGFIPAYDGDSDVYYKVVDGVCRAFNKTDATAGGDLSVTFFVGDYDKRAAEKARKEEAARASAEQAKENARIAAEQAKDAAKAAAESAKGLFKKFTKR